MKNKITETSKDFCKSEPAPCSSSQKVRSLYSFSSDDCLEINFRSSSDYLPEQKSGNNGSAGATAHNILVLSSKLTSGSADYLKKLGHIENFIKGVINDVTSSSLACHKDSETCDGGPKPSKSGSYERKNIPLLSNVREYLSSLQREAEKRGDSENAMSGKALENLNELLPQNISIIEYDYSEESLEFGLDNTFANFSRIEARKFGASLFNFSRSLKAEELNIFVMQDISLPEKYEASLTRTESSEEIKNLLDESSEEKAKNISLALFAAEAGAGMELRRYHFNDYYSSKADKHKYSLRKANFYLTGPVTDKEAKEGERLKCDNSLLINICENKIESNHAKEVKGNNSASLAADIASKVFAFSLEPIVRGNISARRLVNEPGNTLYPETFADACLDMGDKLGFEVDVLDHDKIAELGMGAFTAVEKGSKNRGRIVIMKWLGNPSSSDVTAIVGKGVTFDTGGINLKGSSYISDMKYDMGGAAAVFGAIETLARRKARANVIGVLACAENMPSGCATRPGDIVKSYSGHTIEIDNTDAEGRLVLCDAISYVQDLYKPKALIDLATLTGAMPVALGDIYAGLFSNDDDISSQLTISGHNAAERLWRMPTSKDGGEYDKQVDSKCADIKNVGQAGRGAGSITAAQFLQRFIRPGCKWAHIDIAGVAWSKVSVNPIFEEGPTGFGVMLLNEWIREFCEV